MLAERLKQARREAGLSQRQLCGDVITRNMLSQIESGKARPSMQTLTYLAQTLGKPVSWFLGEMPEPQPAEQTLAQARLCYKQGQHEQCLELLDVCQQQDMDAVEELWLLRALCQLALAKQAVEEGKLRYGASLLEKVSLAGKHTPYYTAPMERERILCLYQCAPEQAVALAGGIAEDDRELLLRAQKSLRTGNFAQVITLLNAAGNRDAHWHYLYGQAAMGQQLYREAADHYLAAEQAYPLACAKALETCFRELEDYKLAYQYACKQRQV